MTAVDTESMTVLQELLDERQRYEGWILALEQRKSTTAPHVYTRVHTDYTLRLERVLHRLSERTEQLQETVQGMTTRLTALRGREADRTDARQEAELRASVGEYTDEEWDRLREEADLEIAIIAEERGGVEAELVNMERIMEMIRPTPAAAEPSAERDSPLREPSLPPPQPSSNAAPSEPVSQATPVDAPSIENFVADWSLRREGVGRPPRAAAAPAHGPGISSSKAPAPPLEERPSVDAKRDQEKTLKCPECGAMNYATEWYCERCGGELATF